MTTDLNTDMNEQSRRLFDAAVDVRERSHTPYSHYPVGAALRTTTGEVFAGCNVENAAYPEGTCAEAGAIASMVASRGGDTVIAEIVTVTAGDTPGTPCGGCRQKIREFASAATLIRACTLSGAQLVMSIDELLPASFGPERLLAPDAES